MKRIFFTMICVALLSSMVLAQAQKPPIHKSHGVKRNGTTTCDPSESPTLATDGSTILDSVSPNSTNYYVVYLLDGHSYSVEAVDPLDLNGVDLSFNLLASDCSTVLPTTVTWQIDPVLWSAFSWRISWIQSGTTNAIVAIPNPDTVNGYYYNIRITDTTLHNPRWSTYSGFITQYAFVNTTQTDISGTLTVYDNSGTQEFAPINLTVPAGGESFQTVSSPANHFGFATFAFVGPSGAIQADAYFINSNATVVTPSTFAQRVTTH